MKGVICTLNRKVFHVIAVGTGAHLMALKLTTRRIRISEGH